MTTLSSARSLVSSLTTRAERCADDDIKHNIGCHGRQEGDDYGNDVNIEDDEDIASIEADGGASADLSGDGEKVEKQMLTAALVSSIVELAGTPLVARTSSVGETEPHVANVTRRRSLRKRTPDRKSTAPASSSSWDETSLSPEVSRKSHHPSQVETSGRTLLASSEKVASSNKFSPGTKKRNLNSKSNTSESNVSIRHSSSHQSEILSPKTVTAPAKPPKYNPTLIKTGFKGSKLNPLVPNPLAIAQESSFHMNCYQSNSKSKGFTKKTNTLMSAAPHALLTDPNHHPSHARTMQMGGQLANIAESMSSQYYQTDDLTASCVDQGGSRSRGRIFSIDLDPAVLDFVENIVDPLACEKTDMPTNEASGSGNTFCAKNSCIHKSGREQNSGCAPGYRDRGFSFEFFSFGINEDEPLPPVPTTCGSMVQNRLRGDSIIFDPTSFCEGGIHETSALLQVKQEKRNEGYHCTTTRVTSTAPDSARSTSATTMLSLPSKSICAPADIVNSVTDKIHHQATSSRFESHIQNKCRRSKCPITSRSDSQQIPGIALPSSRFSDDTIHMPHGSDAAAAAAAGFTQTSIATPNNLSHTACPLELLNKEGRIGIYLPEERKARIAKFHSKRKIRIWRKRIKYDCRKKLADSRPRVKGRFVKRSDVASVAR